MELALFRLFATRNAKAFLDFETRKYAILQFGEFSLAGGGQLLTFARVGGQFVGSRLGTRLGLSRLSRLSVRQCLCPFSLRRNLILTAPEWNYIRSPKAAVSFNHGQGGFHGWARIMRIHP